MTDVVCRWCARAVQLVRDLWLTYDGELCTPQHRGPCRLWYYRDLFRHRPARAVPPRRQLRVPAHHHASAVMDGA